jgi:hypothetical protein
MPTQVPLGLKNSKKKVSNAKSKPKNLSENMEQDIRNYMNDKSKLTEKIFEGNKSKPKINKNKKK